MYHTLTEHEAIKSYQKQLEVFSYMTKEQRSRASRISTILGFPVFPEATHGGMLAYANKILQRRASLSRSAPAPFVNAVMSFVINAQQYCHYETGNTMLDDLLNFKPVYVQSYVYVKEEVGCKNEYNNREI